MVNALVFACRLRHATELVVSWMSIFSLVEALLNGRNVYLGRRPLQCVVFTSQVREQVSESESTPDPHNGRRAAR